LKPTTSRRASKTPRVTNDSREENPWCQSRSLPLNHWQGRASIVLPQKTNNLRSKRCFGRTVFCPARECEEEEHRVHELEQSAEHWSKAKRIREYVFAVIDEHKRAGEELGPDTLTGIWVVWALQQADRLDPLVKSPRSILDRKKELESE
jgi:hypothetical protein